MSNFKYVDLYSGIGGFRIALDSLGGESLGFSEIDRAAIETYKLNFKDPDHHNLGDVTLLASLPAKIDVLVGGVPCQSWSVAGKMKGFSDPRGKLWFNTIEMVRLSRPKVFIFENVKGLSDPRNKSNLELIVKSFEKLGYLVKYSILNAFDFGCPQNRSRIFLVGFRNDFSKNFELFKFPTGEKHTRILANYLDGLNVKNMRKEKFSTKHLFGDRVPASRNSFQTHDEFNDFFVFCDTRNGHTTIHSWDIKNTTKSQKNICMTILKNRRKKNYGVKDGNPISFVELKKLLPDATMTDVKVLVKMKILRFTDGEKIDLFHSKNSAGIDGVYRVYLPNSKIFSTLTATGTKDYVALDYVSGGSVQEYKSNFINNIYKLRKFRQITPKEAARIQGFPSDYKLHPKSAHAHKQIGNSVAPPVVKSLMIKVIETGVI